MTTARRPGPIKPKREGIEKNQNWQEYLNVSFSLNRPAIKTLWESRFPEVNP